MKNAKTTLAILLTLVTVFIFTSCKEKSVETNEVIKEQVVSEEKVVEQKTEPRTQQEPEVVREKLDESVIWTIRERFHKEYGEGTRMEEEIVESSYAGTILNITYYSIPTLENAYNDFYIISINIPLTIHPDLKGDLNRDGKDDLIAWTGLAYGNIETTEYHIFINNNDEYQLVYSSGKYFPFSSDGESLFFSSYFGIEKIEDNLIIGEMHAYTKDDARCCPSLHYDIKMKFENNDLHLIEKKERVYDNE